MRQEVRLVEISDNKVTILDALSVQPEMSSEILSDDTIKNELKDQILSLALFNPEIKYYAIILVKVSTQVDEKFQTHYVPAKVTLLDVAPCEPQYDRGQLYTP